MRLSPDEHEAWKEAARRDERTLSDFIRRVVNASLSDVMPHHGSVTHAVFPPVPIPPAAWPVAETVPQEERETRLTPTEALGPMTPDAETNLDDRQGEGLQHVGGGEPDVLSLKESGPSPAPRSECSNTPFHVRGRFCNYCGKVV